MPRFATSVVVQLVERSATSATFASVRGVAPEVRRLDHRELRQQRAEGGGAVGGHGERAGDDRVDHVLAGAELAVRKGLDLDAAAGSSPSPRRRCGRSSAPAGASVGSISPQRITVSCARAGAGAATAAPRPTAAVPDGEVASCDGHGHGLSSLVVVSRATMLHRAAAGDLDVVRHGAAARVRVAALDRLDHAEVLAHHRRDQLVVERASRSAGSA